MQIAGEEESFQKTRNRKGNPYFYRAKIQLEDYWKEETISEQEIRKTEWYWLSEFHSLSNSDKKSVFENGGLSAVPKVLEDIKKREIEESRKRDEQREYWKIREKVAMGYNQ